jgi:DNA-binding CsgD family transcriptional regulator
LHTFIPSYGNTFFWVNAQYQIINMYDETSADLIVIGQYLQEYVNRGEREVIPALVRLCQALQGVFNGDPHTARPPMWHHGNPWGHFTFRAYWLEPAKPGTEGLIGITVQLQESVLLQCLRRMQEVRLSAREAEVGLWLLRGYTTQKIVERLYISVHTVIDHLRNLYEKLDVHGREELITKLLNRTPGTEREG